MFMKQCISKIFRRKKMPAPPPLRVVKKWVKLRNEIPYPGKKRIRFEDLGGLLYCRATVSKHVRYFERTGTYLCLKSRKIRKDAKIQPSGALLIARMLRRQPKLRQKDTAALYHELTGFAVSRKNVCNILKVIDWTHKRVTRIFPQRSYIERYLFCLRHLSIFGDQDERIVCEDEAISDGRRMACRAGWSPKGERCYAPVFNSRGPIVSIILAISPNQAPHARVFYGTVNGAEMAKFARLSLLSWMNAWPGPRSALKADNAMVHSDPEFIRLLRAKGVLIIPLPAYSPDYQPCESVFGQVKGWTGSVEGERHLFNGRTTKEVVSFGLMRVTVEHVNNYFRSIKYVP
jgi:hypothetical protein